MQGEGLTATGRRGLRGLLYGIRVGGQSLRADEGKSMDVKEVLVASVLSVKTEAS